MRRSTERILTTHGGRLPDPSMMGAFQQARASGDEGRAAELLRDSIRVTPPATLSSHRTWWRTGSCGDMQLHVHSQISHIARTSTDGKWRAPDSLGCNEHLGAVGAITAQHLEEALSKRFGLEWTARDDGHGFEISGISGEMMQLFSSRRESINADLRSRAARFAQQHGRAPSQRELAQLAQSSTFATRKDKEGALDTQQLHAGWADRLARRLGVPLAEVAPSVWHANAGRAAGNQRGARQAPERCRMTSFCLARRSRRSRWRSGRRALGPARTWSSTWAGCCPAPAGTRPRQRHCWRTWPTGRCALSSSRCCAWKRPSRPRSRTACYAPGGTGFCPSWLTSR
jgi:TrwC relaxase